jgi:hypothetical protein
LWTDPQPNKGRECVMANRAILFLGPSGHVTLRGGPRDRTLSAYLGFPFFHFRLLNFGLKAHKMRRVDLIEATMQGWARLDEAQRERFFEAFVKAALRLDQLALRAWLRRRLQYPPLAAIDPAAFAISDVDIALLLRAAGKAPGEAAAGPDRDKADGG